MAAVVNVLRFKEPVDPGLFHRAQDELGVAMSAIGGFQALHIVQTSDPEVILIILGSSTHVLDRIATEVGSPWMIAQRATASFGLTGAPYRRRDRIGHFLTRSVLSASRCR